MFSSSTNEYVNAIQGDITVTPEALSVNRYVREGELILVDEAALLGNEINLT